MPIHHAHAQVLEAEQELRRQLREAQRTNAGLLDKLAAVKATISTTDKLHTHHLHGKVRHLLASCTGVGGSTSSATPAKTRALTARPSTSDAGAQSGAVTAPAAGKAQSARGRSRG